MPYHRVLYIFFAEVEPTYVLGNKTPNSSSFFFPPGMRCWKRRRPLLLRPPSVTFSRTFSKGNKSPKYDPCKSGIVFIGSKMLLLTFPSVNFCRKKNIFFFKPCTIYYLNAFHSAQFVNYKLSLQKYQKSVLLLSPGYPVQYLCSVGTCANHLTCLTLARGRTPTPKGIPCVRQRDFHSRSPLKKKREKKWKNRCSIFWGRRRYIFLSWRRREGIIGNGSGFGSVGRETERGLRIIWNIRRISPI